MSLSDADKIVAYIEARVRPTICPTYSSAGKQSIEGRITRDDFDHLIGLVQSLRASRAKVVEIVRLYVDPQDVRPEHEALVRALRGPGGEGE